MEDVYQNLKKAWVQPQSSSPNPYELQLQYDSINKERSMIKCDGFIVNDKVNLIDLSNSLEKSKLSDPVMPQRQNIQNLQQNNIIHQQGNQIQGIQQQGLQRPVMYQQQGNRNQVLQQQSHHQQLLQQQQGHLVYHHQQGHPVVHQQHGLINVQQHVPGNNSIQRLPNPVIPQHQNFMISSNCGENEMSDMIPTVISDFLSSSNVPAVVNSGNTELSSNSTLSISDFSQSQTLSTVSIDDEEDEVDVEDDLEIIERDIDQSASLLSAIGF